MIDDGAEAYGEDVWSWHPMLVSSLRRFCSAQPGLTKPLIRRRRVATELSRRGERVINRKPIAWGVPDVSGASLVTRVRDGRFLHARLRVLLGIAAFPAPSVISRAVSYLAKPGRLAPRGV
jgi:hypothetical protein